MQKFQKNDPFFRCEPGRAFWVIRRGNLPIAGPVNGAPLESDGAVSIDLHKQGFNLISNPYPLPVSWDTVWAFNAYQPTTKQPPLYGFQGTWQAVKTLEPYQGYCFYNPGKVQTLKVPFPHRPMGVQAPGQPAEDEYHWRSRIRLSAGNLKEEIAFFGISRQAAAGYDPLDIPRPRALPGIPGVSFEHPEWRQGAFSFASDVRPPGAVLHEWPFEVQALPGQQEPKKYALTIFMDTN